MKVEINNPPHSPGAILVELAPGGHLSIHTVKPGLWKVVDVESKLHNVIGVVDHDGSIRREDEGND